jgi:hypothetical protein
MSGLRYRQKAYINFISYDLKIAEFPNEIIDFGLDTEMHCRLLIFEGELLFRYR